MEAPEQMLVMKGGRATTNKIGDFELFGHTHPGEYYPHPSNTDLSIMEPFRPEFIVAQKTGKTIILNIEDYDRWKDWQSKTNIKDKTLTQVGRNVDTKWGRESVFKTTGVKVYPMAKNLKIEMIDNPTTKKQFPRASPITVIEWHSSNKPIPASEFKTILKSNEKKRCEKF